jgi:hypothetical protein
MYCPKCATQNSEDTKFCRGCGAPLSLVSQALTGRISEERSAPKREARVRDKSAGLQGGIANAFLGLGFLIATIALLFTGESWGVWMLIPAFACLGKGVASIVAFKYDNPSRSQAVPYPGATNPPRNTGELAAAQPTHQLPPPSVTEGTTKIFDPEVERLREKA